MEYTELGQQSVARIKVIGVGGAGGNAVNNMVQSDLSRVTFIAANTDMQALDFSLADHKIQLGQKLTRGLGAGANPAIGCEAAKESIALIKEVIGEAEMVFVTAGMGGGTGTGAAPVVAQVAKEMGALTVGVVSKPFGFEGKRRMAAAEAGIMELRQHVDSLITIPNSRLVQLAHKKATFQEMLKQADNVLFHAVKGISDLLLVPGLINLDFADVKAVMGESGLALMGAGIASGEGRAKEAATRAITSPLLEDVTIDGARGVLLNISSGPGITIEEVEEAATIIHDAAHEDAAIYFGAVFDETLGDDLRITVIATGIDNVAFAGDTSSKYSRVPGLPQHNPQRPERPQRPSMEIYRGAQGQGRPLTPGGDMDRPTGVRQAELGHSGGVSGSLGGLGGFGGMRPAGPYGHAPGEDDFIFNEDDMDIPSFIRKQAN
ncbi:cell division protein FtsZ [Desulfovibrio sp. OttesenSCG-928-C14]|nr:cell division protein FtsZ [Desulfovibrio sp. OttesenSCG-928-C14]